MFLALPTFKLGMSFLINSTQYSSKGRSFTQIQPSSQDECIFVEIQDNIQADDVFLLVVGGGGGADKIFSACVSIYTSQKSPTLIPQT